MYSQKPNWVPARFPMARAGYTRLGLRLRGPIGSKGHLCQSGKVVRAEYYDVRLGIGHLNRADRSLAMVLGRTDYKNEAPETFLVRAASRTVRDSRDASYEVRAGVLPQVITRPPRAGLERSLTWATEGVMAVMERTKPGRLQPLATQ